MRHLPALAAGSAALFLSLATPQRSAIEVGQEASYSFRESPFNGLGVKSLEELRGKPVLVDFWGTR
jgi:hypothetical protein